MSVIAKPPCLLPRWPTVAHRLNLLQIVQCAFHLSSQPSSWVDHQRQGERRYYRIAPSWAASAAAAAVAGRSGNG